MVSTNLNHPKVGQLEYLMFHTSHIYTQCTSCSITCLVAESCHEEHGQRKDDTQSKQALSCSKSEMLLNAKRALSLPLGRKYLVRKVHLKGCWWY